MLTVKQVINLIDLIDLEYLENNVNIINELEKYGILLEDMLSKNEIYLSHSQKSILHPLFLKNRLVHIEQQWAEQFDYLLTEDILENTLGILSSINYGVSAKNFVNHEIDQLVEEYRNKYVHSNSFESLLDFLFKEKQYQGTYHNFYNPLNNDLLYVISEKKGLPITLSILLILLSKKTGYNIEGCNLPGHFMCITHYKNKNFLIDAYNNGKIISESNIALSIALGNRRKKKYLKKKLFLPAKYIIMISRAFKNLIVAYQKQNNLVLSRFFYNLLKKTQRIEFNKENKIEKTIYPNLEIGQIVYHKRYQYRGVIVDYDIQCQADEFWYYANQCQPSPEQPWYHILVDGTDHTTYAAQINLKVDMSNQTIQHPLIPFFFDDFYNGVYKKNARPWPGI